MPHCPKTGNNAIVGWDYRLGTLDTARDSAIAQGKLQHFAKLANTIARQREHANQLKSSLHSKASVKCHPVNHTYD